MDRSLTSSKPAPAEAARSLPLGDLLSLGAQQGADITLDGLLREAVEIIHRTLGYPQVYIRLRDTDTDALEALAFAGVAAEDEARLRANPTAPSSYQSWLQPPYRIGDSYLVPAMIDVEGGAADGAQGREDGPGTLLVPLRGRSERLLGVIYIRAANDQGYAPANIQVLEALARQSALAIENVRLADRTARLLAKEQLLAELGRDVSTTLDLDKILDRTVARLEVAFQGQGCTILLVNDASELEVAAAGREIDQDARGVRLRVGQGIAGWVAQQGRPYLSNDVDAESTVLPAARQVGSNRLIRSYIAVPLRTGGQVIGAITVAHTQPGAFSYEDVDLLEAIAAQIGGPLGGAQLYERSQRLAAQVQRRAEQLTVLNTLARAATATLDLEHMLAEVTHQISSGFGYNHVELYLLNDETNELVLEAQAGGLPPGRRGHRQAIQHGLLGRTVRTGLTQRVDDVLQDPDYVRFDMPDTRAELCVPIVAGGRVLGVLNVESVAVGAFGEEDVALLETSADVLAGAIDNDRLYRRAQEAAVLKERNRLARDLHDSVTQQLFSMTLTAQAARAQLEKNPQRAAAQLERLQETAAAALAEMRALIFQLRPPALSEQGLISALQQHVAALSRREGLRIELAKVGDEAQARGAEQAIYRIVQEALNNVVKHAGASMVRVSLDFSTERIRLSVADDGVGFDVGAQAGGLVAQVGNGRHMGLVGMRERAAELGGSMELRSAPGGGTEVIVVVPKRAGGNDT
jgi:signal transduction histidine kinase